MFHVLGIGLAIVKVWLSRGVPSSVPSSSAPSSSAPSSSVPSSSVPSSSVPSSSSTPDTFADYTHACVIRGTNILPGYPAFVFSRDIDEETEAYPRVYLSQLDVVVWALVLDAASGDWLVFEGWTDPAPSVEAVRYFVPGDPAEFPLTEWVHDGDPIVWTVPSPCAVPCEIMVTNAGTASVDGVYARCLALEDATYDRVYVRRSAVGESTYDSDGSGYRLMREADTCTWKLVNGETTYYWRLWIMGPCENEFETEDWEVTGGGAGPAPDFLALYEVGGLEGCGMPCQLDVYLDGNENITGTYPDVGEGDWPTSHFLIKDDDSGAIRFNRVTARWELYDINNLAFTMPGIDYSWIDLMFGTWTPEDGYSGTPVISNVYLVCDSSSVPSSSALSSSVPSSSAPSSSAPSSTVDYQGPGYYLMENQGWSCTEESGWVVSGGPYSTCEYLADEAAYNEAVRTLADLNVERPCVAGEYGASEETHLAVSFWGEDSACGGT